MSDNFDDEHRKQLKATASIFESTDDDHRLISLFFGTLFQASWSKQFESLAWYLDSLLPLPIIDWQIITRLTIIQFVIQFANYYDHSLANLKSTSCFLVPIENYSPRNFPERNVLKKRNVSRNAPHSWQWFNNNELWQAPLIFGDASGLHNRTSSCVNLAHHGESADLSNSLFKRLCPKDSVGTLFFVTESWKSWTSRQRFEANDSLAFVKQIGWERLSLFE